MGRFISYCFIGGINTATDLSAFVFLTTELKVAAALANFISCMVAFCVSFVLNRTFTFRSSTFALILPVQVYRFLGINVFSLLGSTAAIWLLSGIMVPIAAKLVTIPLVIAWGFFAVRLLVFQPGTRPCCRAHKKGAQFWGRFSRPNPSCRS
jgi:putative flippase GtrA